MPIRRDLALQEALTAAVEARRGPIDADATLAALTRFEDRDLRDTALSELLVRLERWPEARCDEPGLLRLLQEVGSISSAAVRCQAALYGLRLLAARDSSEATALRRRLEEMFEAAWDEIDPEWVKVDVGFRAAKLLARASPSMARQQLARAEELRKRVTLHVGEAAGAYMLCTRLAIRAFGGLLARNDKIADELASLKRCIDRIPSIGERAALWADAAILAFRAKRYELGRQLVEQYVRPLSQSLPAGDRTYRADILVTIAPALYIAHQATAFDLIASLEAAADRDRAYQSIADYIVHGCLPSDPHDESGTQVYELDYAQIRDLIELLHRIDSDVLIHSVIDKISRSLSARAARHRISDGQRREVVRLLRRVVNARLPNPRYIKHEGWVVACAGQVLRIERASQEEWRKLAERARGVPNASDRCFVITIVADMIPSKHVGLRRELLEEAFRLVSSIPTLHDRLDRYKLIATHAMRYDQGLARRSLQEAVREMRSSPDDPDQSVQRSIIDTAYQVDPEFAASLASLYDDDPARKRAQADLKEHLELLRLRNAIANNDEEAIARYKDEERRRYSGAAWALLGSLNARRVSPIGMDQARQYIEIAAAMPFDDAYPILAWVVECGVVRYGRTEQAMTVVRPMFEAIVFAVDLIHYMAERSAGRTQRIIMRASRQKDRESLLVPGDARHVAIDFIAKWFEDEATEYLLIADPYFGPEDLELITLLSTVKPGLVVEILTSRKHLEQEHVSAPWDAAFRAAWRDISAQDPPVTDIVVVGTESGKSPIHDRWWLTKGGGLRVGTSFNALGRSSESEISRLTSSEAEEREVEVREYLHRRQRVYKDERLSYFAFSL